MPNYNHLFSLDEESGEMLKEVPKSRRSAYVRDAIKTKFISDLNGKPKEQAAKQAYRVKIQI